MQAHRSLWTFEDESASYPQLTQDISADIAIIGAGITGLTTAYRLLLAGKKVVILEKGRVLSGETGNTTAHLTEVLDTRYYELISDFGLATVQAVAASVREAIEFISQVSKYEGFDCDFERLPGYLYSETGHDFDELSQELKAAEKAGIDCVATLDVPLPFRVGGAIRFEEQAQCNPGKYLRSLALLLGASNVSIFENTPVTRVNEGEPCEIETAKGRVRAKQVVIAANVPINNRFSMHTKLAAYRSYALAVVTPMEQRVEGLFWDTMDPYHYSRTAFVEFEGRKTRVLVIGGEDHKTGARLHTEKCYRQLEVYARERFEIERVVSEWSGQIIETVDGLPYIGKNPHSRDIYIASGYSGNGMTFGTVAGMLLADLVQGNENAWDSLYSPGRLKPLVSAVPFLTENTDYPMHLIGDRLAAKDALGLLSVVPGEGKIVRVGRKPVAVYRDEKMRLHGFSPVCSHLGCYVGWNKGEKTWDCPCHGSRFDTEGNVLNGPALSPLSPVDLEAETELERRRQGNNVPGEAA